MKSVTRLILALDEEQLHTSNNVVVIDMGTDQTTVNNHLSHLLICAV